MIEAKINTNFGDIRITYNNTEELQATLTSLEEQIKMISDVTSKITPSAPRTPKNGFENAYRFSPNGSAELIYFPAALLHLAVLALFVYYPETVATAELEKVTGIKDIVGKFLGQTKNKKFFRKANDSSYGLSLDGLKLVNEKVKPLFNSGNESSPE